MGHSTRQSLIVLGCLGVVVIALFVLSVAYPSRGTREGSGFSAGDRETWRSRLVPADPVARGQLSGCATAPGELTIATGCALKVAAAGARSRKLSIRAIDAVEVRRVTDADGRRMTMRARLEPGKSTQVFVGKDGETIGLRCLSGATCRAAVE
jgi:hypothetical protein